MSALSAYRVSAATTTVAISPPSTVVNVGDTFNVNVTVADIFNFTSWELKLYYLKAILNCTNAVEGPFLKIGGGTFFNKTIINNYNSTHGYILPYSTLLGIPPPPLVNGSGVIVIITFKAIGGGNTPLVLADTKLGDEKIPPLPIPHVDVNGAVTVIGGGHDVTVVSVTTSKDGCEPMPSVPGDSFAKVNVTVLNQGSYTETNINVTVYANTTSVASQNVTLSSGNSIIITFTWNTLGFAKGNYTISAYAWPVPGETHTADNNYTYGLVQVTIMGDVDGNGNVNVLDAIDLSNSFGKNIGQTGFNPNADFDDNGVLNILDAITLANNFGQHYP
jgi:hypothetical protein